nr:Chain C, 5c1 peptide [synthetic construct]4P2R_H Chain H, 5c1 peptide [synthetic construct]4P2R_M Chain M, 5c1 peptide [synthetic construct]4P2R_R Chain R, 5c1 peptide [synthetic construct]
ANGVAFFLTPFKA